ncbi:hypothetical protein ATCC51562_30 [Campylobacter concisus ATCC 51562]|uniref:Uncharacterized protein n=1 Tax=Campylobacter concisus ATCC 51562 TaxID=1242969 RepID=U2EPX3_9BACT|nr:hypothetical protein ATCC51562_30 [Campylobacter concisus ATCC 51562]
MILKSQLWYLRKISKPSLNFNKLIFLAKSKTKLLSLYQIKL